HTVWSFGRKSPRWSADRRRPVARDGPCLANTVVALRRRDRSLSAPLGAPPTPRGAGQMRKATNRGAETRRGNEEDWAVVETRRCGDDDAGPSQELRRERGALTPRLARRRPPWRGGSVPIPA